MAHGCAVRGARERTARTWRLGAVRVSYVSADAQLRAVLAVPALSSAHRSSTLDFFGAGSSPPAAAASLLIDTLRATATTHGPSEPTDLLLVSLLTLLAPPPPPTSADARYTEWRVWHAGCVADWSAAGLDKSELYDHTGDDGFGTAAYDDFENVNLVHEPARER